MVKRIEAPDLEILSPIERAGAAACPEYRNGFGKLFPGTDLFVPEFQETLIKIGAGFTGFLAPVGAGKKDLRGNAKNRRIGKAIEKRPEETAIHDHVVVEEDDYVGLGLRDTPIVPACKTVVAIQREDPHVRKTALDKVHASVGAPVVDDDDVMLASITAYGLQN